MPVLCIMDMTTLGRASLSVALPVLSVCGVQCCPLPGALFSSHTGGFSQVEREDAAAFGQRALQRLVAEGAVFSGICVGYLYSEAQFALAKAAFGAWPGARKVVDPALADGGRLYKGLGAGAVEGMKDLMAGADLLTPNATESGLLLGEAYDAPPTMAGALARLEQLAAICPSVLITGLPGGDNTLVTLGCENGFQNRFSVEVQKQGEGYPGTGDIFTAVVTALTLRGWALEAAVRLAAGFVERAIDATRKGGGPVREGLWFEPCLGWLAERVL